VTKKAKPSKDNILVKMTEIFFTRWKATLLLWLFLLSFGALTYTTLIKREGFPPIQFPVSFVNGLYFVNDKNVVDEKLAVPFYDAVKSIEGVSKIETTSNDNNFIGVIYFEQSVSPQDGAQKIRDAVSNKQSNIPSAAQLSVISIDPASYLNKYDLLLSVYSLDNQSISELEEVADYVSRDMVNDEVITVAEKQPLLSSAPNPSTGKTQEQQTAFNQIGLPNENGKLEFNQAITIGVDRDAENFDAIELSDAVKARINALDLSQFDGGYAVVAGADFAEQIKTQIGSLESNLLTGLIAVALVSLLLITWRASVITGLFMLSVMAVTVALLYVFGYTLNTITLFALVLSLGLFVDDATIVVESIDSMKDKKKKPKEVVRQAVSKIGAASFSGTFTTVLVFMPLAFISGVLGEFIRLMPITVIIALISSLILSLTLIPVLAKFVLLNSDKISWFTRVNPVSKAEAKLGNFIGNLPRLLTTRKKLGKWIASGLTVMSIVGIFLALQVAGLVQFNIFPSSKDSDQIGVSLSFPSGYTIVQAEKTSQVVNKIVAEEVGDLAKRVTYGSFSLVQPNSRSADLLIDLVPFTERERASPQILESLEAALVNLPDGTKARVSQFDQGPPADEYPMKVQVYDSNLDRRNELANEIKEYLTGKQIEKVSIPSIFKGKEYFEVRDIALREQSSVSRVDGDTFTEVSGRYDGSDTSALLQNTKTVLEEHFNAEYLEGKGYSTNAVTYNFGQESENAESFAALGLVFPLALLMMFILLAVQFKSLLQPLLIFMAIPFTFLGVFLGLLITDNSLSFFVMIGLIGLIGIAVNNTILLTTYANQERELGEPPVNAISNAVTKRFRPLLATTLTTIVALLPLALSDPFWEPLAFTIIFGLVSSTFFVLLSFPYYYLGAEWLRMRILRLFRSVRKSARS
jgi:multidrug efflux pump subunit AcrB